MDQLEKLDRLKSFSASTDNTQNWKYKSTMRQICKSMLGKPLNVLTMIYDLSTNQKVA